MKVYLMRHGIALDLKEGGVSSDADRPLSTEGREKTREVAKGLKRLGVEPSICLVSPLRRAMETAEIVANTLKCSVGTCSALAPGGSPDELLDEIAAHHPDDVLVVGHMPDLGSAILHFIGAVGGHLELKKAGVACVEFDGKPRAGRGVLLWLAPPAITRRLDD